MPKIQFNGNQYTITIPKDAIERMKWGAGTIVYIGKDPDRELLFIEELPADKKRKGM